jgi:hypothetical protein
MRIDAFITETAPVKRIPSHIGEPSKPPPITPTRAPPDEDGARQTPPHWDALAQPEPEYQFDQRVYW